MLTVDNATVKIGTKTILDHISISVEKGKVLGVVGESGSGKTMTALFAMGLLPDSAVITEGSATLDGKMLTGLSEREMSNVRGNDIAMIFQEPMTSLNPTMKIGKQLEEAVLLHENKMPKDELREKVIDALKNARLSDAENLYNKYPHELSGGMRQRVMIAMGCILNPDYLLCDEPTTALDVVTEGEIVSLIKNLKDSHNIGVIFITHDLNLLKNFADDVAVMCGGKLVEKGTWEEIFLNPKEEYTKKLIAAIPNRNIRKRVIDE